MDKHFEQYFVLRCRADKYKYMSEREDKVSKLSLVKVELIGIIALVELKEFDTSVA